MLKWRFVISALIVFPALSSAGIFCSDDLDTACPLADRTYVTVHPDSTWDGWFSGAFAHLNCSAEDAPATRFLGCFEHAVQYPEMLFKYHGRWNLEGSCGCQFGYAANRNWLDPPLKEQGGWDTYVISASARYNLALYPFCSTPNAICPLADRTYVTVHPHSTWDGGVSGAFTELNCSAEDAPATRFLRCFEHAVQYPEMLFKYHGTWNLEGSCGCQFGYAANRNWLDPPLKEQVGWDTYVISASARPPPPMPPPSPPAIVKVEAGGEINIKSSGSLVIGSSPPCWSEPISGASPGPSVDSTTLATDDITPCKEYCEAHGSACGSIEYYPATGRCWVLNRKYEGHYTTDTAGVGGMVANYMC